MRKSIRKFLPLLFLLAAALPAFAQIPDALLKKAEGGDAAAQLEVATKYMSGDGVEVDTARALDWLGKSAAGGNREAIFSLGMLYRNGKLVTQNAAEAVKWFGKAAELGDAYAQHALGAMYQSGEGVTQDTAAAVKWWIEAAEGGHGDAQLKAGTAYLQARGVDEDFARAYFWLSFPSEGDVLPGEAQAMRDLAASQLKPEKREEIKKQVENWVARDYRETKEKAEKGDAASQTAIAQLYQRGSGAIKNVRIAEEWLRKAAAGGDAEGQFLLGEMLAAHGRWEFKEALEWFLKAEKQGHVAAAVRIGDFYAEGSGVERADAAAAAWYRKAADKGNAQAQSKLGAMYLEGKGVPRDPAEALFWLSVAAAQGHDRHADLRQSASEILSPDQKEAVKKRLRDLQERAQTQSAP